MLKKTTLDVVIAMKLMGWMTGLEVVLANLNTPFSVAS